MTTLAVTQAIRAFLRTPFPQVLCIRGKWGVGKTHIWRETLKEAVAGKDVGMPRYCYVSLFGLQSIDEVRQSIFENSTPTEEIELGPSFESLKKNVEHYTSVAIKKMSKVITFAQVPVLDNYIHNFAGGFRQILSLTVKETIICFDDFERKKIDTKDLLGLISQLHTERSCNTSPLRP